ncbi:hypothetical protein CPB86DRAFT_801942 [Serendipita vermifera]|nr:hypothetical protein CPB86DRAFT_801942 [Serendipita vermifera]
MYGFPFLAMLLAATHLSQGIPIPVIDLVPLWNHGSLEEQEDLMDSTKQLNGFFENAGQTLQKAKANDPASMAIFTSLFGPHVSNDFLDKFDDKMKTMGGANMYVYDTSPKYVDAWANFNAKWTNKVGWSSDPQHPKAPAINFFPSGWHDIPSERAIEKPLSMAHEVSHTAFPPGQRTGDHVYTDKNNDQWIVTADVANQKDKDEPGSIQWGRGYIQGGDGLGYIPIVEKGAKGLPPDWQELMWQLKNPLDNADMWPGFLSMIEYEQRKAKESCEHPAAQTLFKRANRCLSPKEAGRKLKLASRNRPVKSNRGSRATFSPKRPKSKSKANGKVKNAVKSKIKTGKVSAGKGGDPFTRGKPNGKKAPAKGSKSRTYKAGSNNRGSTQRMRKVNQKPSKGGKRKNSGGKSAPVVKPGRKSRPSTSTKSATRGRKGPKGSIPAKSRTSRNAVIGKSFSKPRTRVKDTKLPRPKQDTKGKKSSNNSKEQSTASHKQTKVSKGKKSSKNGNSGSKPKKSNGSSGKTTAPMNSSNQRAAERLLGQHGNKLTAQGKVNSSATGHGNAAAGRSPPKSSASNTNTGQPAPKGAKAKSGKQSTTSNKPAQRAANVKTKPKPPTPKKP